MSQTSLLCAYKVLKSVFNHMSLAVVQLRQRLSSLPESLSFSVFPIEKRIVFYATELSFAFTNLKPVVPGHVLISPFRVVRRLSHLSTREVEDLFTTARFVGDAVLKAHPHADSLTFTVQDGPSAGQTVGHVHVHVMPRWATDPFNSSRTGNDAVYAEIDRAEANFASDKRIDQLANVPARSRDSMAEEATELLSVVEQMLKNIDDDNKN